MGSSCSETARRSPGESCSTRGSAILLQIEQLGFIARCGGNPGGAVRGDNMITSPGMASPGSGARLSRTAKRLIGHRVALAAVQSLYEELSAYPKPGLVSPLDSGSHRDMDAPSLFFRSLSPFEPIPGNRADGYGGALVRRAERPWSGGRGADVPGHRRNERHRGSDLNLGLLAAGAGLLLERGERLSDRALGDVVGGPAGERISWRPELPSAGRATGLGRRRSGREGPAWRRPAVSPTSSRSVFRPWKGAFVGGPLRGSRPAVLFQPDGCPPRHQPPLSRGRRSSTWPGAPPGVSWSRGRAPRRVRRCLAASIHREFIRRDLSPGGSADLLCGLSVRATG